MKSGATWTWKTKKMWSRTANRQSTELNGWNSCVFRRIERYIGRVRSKPDSR